MALISGEPIGDGLWKLPGNDIFGVEWVVECADAASLELIKPIYEAIKTAEDKQVATSTALSGSAAYLGRMNPFPADVDFNEIVLVKASSLRETTWMVKLLVRGTGCPNAGTSGSVGAVCLMYRPRVQDESEGGTPCW